MDWSVIEDVYLALTRIFDGFINFLLKAFDIEE